MWFTTILPRQCTSRFICCPFFVIIETLLCSTHNAKHTCRIQAPRSLTPPVWFVFVPGKVERKMEGKIQSMACILKRHKWSYFTEVFQREKITPDIVSDLSMHEMNQLGVNNRETWWTYECNTRLMENRKPQRDVLRCRAPSIDIFKLRPCLSIICKKDSRSKILNLCCPCQKAKLWTECTQFQWHLWWQAGPSLIRITERVSFYGEEVMNFLLREERFACECEVKTDFKSFTDQAVLTTPRSRD